MYSAAFLRLDGVAQVVFVFLLPIVKYFMNSIITHVSAGIPSMRATGMISLKLFDSLYILKCMGSAGSLVSGAVLITLDTCITFEICTRRSEPQTRFGQIQWQYHEEIVIQNSVNQVASRLHLQPIDVSAFLTHTVAPSPSFDLHIPLTPATLLPRNNDAEQVRLDKNVNKLLLEFERLVLVEFIESAIPIFYILYVIALFHSPNVKYYPEMANLDATKLARIVRNVSAYAMLEG